MQKYNYKLKAFIKAVEKIAEQKGCTHKIIEKRDSGIRFEIFRKNETVPENFWVLHSHEQRTVTSKKDYSKAAFQLGIEPGEFLEILESI